MARPMKQGLEYFPLDVDFFDDDKIRLIKAEFKAVGELVLVRLLCKIYKNGYFYKWGGDECLLFCDWAGAIFVPNQVNEVIKGCLRRSIFDDRVFKVFGVLTSRGIQKRYLRAVSERKEVEIIEDLWLLDIPEDTKTTKYKVIRLNNDIKPPNNEINRSDNPQSKVKESKGENINKDIVPTDAGTPPKKPKQPTKEFDVESIEYKSSKFLADKILERNPNAKVPRTDKELFKWCIHIEYLLRLDKRPSDELRKVLMFAVKDSFWSANILSTATLRKKYDMLFMHMSRGKDDARATTKGDSNEKATVNRFAGIERQDAGTGELL